MAVQISTTVEFLPVDTSTRAGTILLPSTNTFAGRIITIKDAAGTFARNPLTLSTIGGQTFEDGTTLKILRDTQGYLTLGSDGFNTWYLIDGTSLNTYTISSITSAIGISSIAVSTTLTTVCTLNFQDTTFGNISTPIYARSTLLYLGSNIIGGARAGPTQFINPVYSFEPRQIAGLAVWLDATNVNGTAFPNPIFPSTVGSWCNLAGGPNFIQPTLSRQPIFLQNGLGLNRPSVYFSSFGTTAGIQFISSTSNIQTTRDASIFFVVNYLSTSFTNQNAVLIDDRKDPAGTTIRTFRANKMEIRDPVSTLVFASFPNEANFPQIRSYRDTLNNSLSFTNGVLMTSLQSNYNQQVADNFGLVLGSHFRATQDASLAASTFSVFHLSEFLLYNRILNQPESQQIESYLGRKWGIQVPSIFSPRDINGLQLWIDASDPTTVSLTGNTVTGVTDKSPNAYVFSNGSGYSYNVVRMNGQYPSFYNSTVATGLIGCNTSFTLSQPLTGFVVGQTNFSTGQYGYLFDSTNAGNRLGPFYYNLTNANLSYFFATGGQIGAYTSPSTFVNTYYGNTTNSQVFANSITRLNGTIGTGALSGMVLGNRHNLASEAWQGHICEMILYNSILSQTQRRLVETYLGQKWGVTIDAPFSPLNVGGLSLWLDASQLVGVTNGATLSQWNDISPNLYGGTAVGNPTYNTNQQNGLPAVSFNGTSQYINFGNILNMGTSQIYAFAACKITNATGGIIGKSAAVGTQGRWTFLRENSSNLFLVDLQGAGFPDFRASYNAPGTTDARVLTGYWDRNNIYSLSNAYFTSNSFSNAASITNLTTSFSLFVGAYQDGTGAAPLAGYYMNGQIYEILVYLGSLTYIQRQQIQNYLSFKWNVPLAAQFLPTDVPGCTIWFDGADNTRVLTSGSSVTSWLNKGSASISLTTTAGTVTRTNIAGTPSLFFNSGGIMTSSTTLIFSSNVTAIFMVIQGVASSGFAMALALSAGNGGNGDYSIRMDGGSSTLYTPGNANDMGFNGGQTATYILNGRPINTSNFSLQGNPNIIYTPVNQTVTSAFTLSTAFFSRFYVGFVCEVLMYSALPNTQQRQLIEGYLAWKWGITIPSPFSPRDIPNLQLWLDAADSSTVTGTTSVSEWRDKSGNNRNATSIASAIVYQNNGMVFSGAQTFSTTLSALMPFQQTFIVMSHASSATIDVLGFNYISGSPGVQVTLSANLQRVAIWGGANVVQGPAITQNTQFIYGYTLNQGATAFLYNTGNQTASAPGSPSFSGSANVYIGSYYNNGSGPFEAFVGIVNEIIIYNVVLSDYNRQQVEGYLAWKWGLAANLPATHPFKNNPPQHPFRNTPP